MKELLDLTIFWITTSFRSKLLLVYKTEGKEILLWEYRGYDIDKTTYRLLKKK